MTDIHRIIVCGSRNYTATARVRAVLAEYLLDDPTIVHGNCGKWDWEARQWVGADRIADEVAIDLGLDTEAHPADWDKYGRAAGPIRNRYMGALGAELCIAFGDGRGTQHMVDTAERRGIPVRREP